MYPLPVLLAVGLLRRDRGVGLYVLPLSIAGAFVAAFHVLLQAGLAEEPGACFVGSCRAVEYLVGSVTIPQASLVAFGAVTALVVGAHLARGAE